MRHLQRFACVLGMGYLLSGAEAAKVLNAQFENNLAHWEVAGDGSGSNPYSPKRKPAFAKPVYDDGHVSNLGTSRMTLNTDVSRSYSATAAVYEDDGKTPQIISRGTWGFTVALGIRDGHGVFYNDCPNVDLIVGYLETPGDRSSFTGLSSNCLQASIINTEISAGHIADYSVSTTVESADAAAGKELVVQIRAFSPADGYKGLYRLQASVDYVRIEAAPGAVKTLGLIIAAVDRPVSGYCDRWRYCVRLPLFNNPAESFSIEQPGSFHGEMPGRRCVQFG